MPPVDADPGRPVGVKLVEEFSGRDLVEELIGYGVWTFAMDLHGRSSAAFVREVEAEAVKIVGKYVPRTETLRSWDIRGSNVRLNCVFELNRLPYASYPGDDDADAAIRQGKKAMATVDEGSSRGIAPSMAAKNRGS